MSTRILCWLTLLLIASKALSPFYRAAKRHFPLASYLGTRRKENFQTNPRHFNGAKRGGIEPKVGNEDVASLREPAFEGSLNSFHGQLQLAFMPRFAYRCEIISRTLSLISVSDVSAGRQETFLILGDRLSPRANFSAKAIF